MRLDYLWPSHAGENAKSAFEDFGSFTTAIATGITKKDSNIYQRLRKEHLIKLFAVRKAIRRELGVDDPVDENQKKE
jgi:hypothetical protein